MKTSDVYLSAALLALGYKLEKVDRKDPRHMIFEFVVGGNGSNLGQVVHEMRKLNLDEIEKAWVNRTLTVNAFDFAEAIKRMKSLIHSS